MRKPLSAGAPDLQNEWNMEFERHILVVDGLNEKLPNRVGRTEMRGRRFVWKPNPRGIRNSNALRAIVKDRSHVGDRVDREASDIRRCPKR
jgi:hypothetical protein